MKGMVIPVLGKPVVVDGDWDDLAAIDRMLSCKYFESYALPNLNGPRLAVLVDEQGKDKELDVNKRVTDLLADQIGPGGYIAGPVLVIGHDAAGNCVDLGLLDLVRLGARLVRAERNALSEAAPRGPGEPKENE